jgi:C4-dicarboxylate-specific signal transduction histidine kinase
MPFRTLRADSLRTRIFQVATILLALGVFAADAFTAPDQVFSGFYVLVVVMSARFCLGRDLWIVSGVCVALTLLAQVLANHLAHANGQAAIGAFNTVDGILVIGVATYFIQRGQQAQAGLQRAQADLARITRVTTMGELTASIAHEVNQPIAAVVTNAGACLRWLDSDAPNLEEARAAATRIVRDGTRAADIISRIRRLFTKGGQPRQGVDVNQLIRETIDVLGNEAARHAVTLRIDLAADLPEVTADRIQLQQVMVNLIVNGIDAMKDGVQTRELTLKTQLSEAREVTVSVSDTGIGFPAQQADQLFDAFFTTKPEGTGMGLSISRSIMEAHHGRLWATPNTPAGAIFLFALPAGGDALSEPVRARA